MAWGRGLFRVWIVLTALWFIAVGVTMRESIADPYVNWGGFDMVRDTPNYLEQDDASFILYKGLAEKKVFTEYEIESEGLWPTSFFFLNTVPEEKAQKEIKELMPRVVATQTAMIRKKRWETLQEAAMMALSPPTCTLVLGLVLRWALIGFRPKLIM
ncbi:hypothetical protein [Agrobacterium cavarae]|uniref:hypothetical protein n=1 Tax=Agrobacterium cavarae TaxID=2528239 RepID=UPI0028A88ECC|nr:hypothetical protein [Agrobacterium cavarae]